MQLKGGPPPVGVMFDAALDAGIDPVLALAVLYGLQSQREARVATLSVSRYDLPTAAFCDALSRFLAGAANRYPAPVGMPAGGRQAQAGSPMVNAVLDKRGPDGKPSYARGINKLNDTADVAAQIRNGISAQQPDNGVVLVAGPLSNIAAALSLPDTAELVSKRVRALVIAAVEGDMRSDLAAARRVFSDWPSPLVMVDPGISATLRFPAAGLERFSWAPDHPVADAYRAYRAMPYDAPLHAAAAALYTARPDSAFFALSGPGTFAISESGAARFVPSSGGRQRSLALAGGQGDAVVEAIMELASSQPPQPGRGGRGKQQAKQDK
jgi:hypothetical protein